MAFNQLVPITLVIWFCGIACFTGGWLLLGKADGKGAGFVVAMAGLAAQVSVFISLAVYAPTNSVITEGLIVGVPTSAAIFLITPEIYGFILTSFGMHAYNGWDLRSQGWLAVYMGITALWDQYLFAGSAFWAIMNFTWVVALWATAAACLTKWPVGKFLGWWLIILCGLFSLLYCSIALATAGWFW